MAERNTQLDSSSAVQAAEDSLHVSYDLTLAGRLNATWDKDSGDLDQKHVRLNWLRTLKRDLIQAGEEGTECSIHTGIWLRILEGDLKKVK